MVIALAAVIGLTAILWPYQTEVTPDGADLEADFQREVLKEIPEVYQPEEASFAVKFKDIVTPYRVMGMFVMPGENVEIEVVLPNRSAQYDVAITDGSLESAGDHAWHWSAPEEPGLYPIHLNERTSGEGVTLNAFVKVPYDLDAEVLNGYRIGNYEREVYQNNPTYRPPEGFIEITPETEDVLVAPHFVLGQFACKQESDYPKYALLREQLLLKLEMVLREINDGEVSVPSLHVMSGFRTPYYNRSIGNTTSFSQHLYGGAADVFVDANDDDYMDDLTEDGEVTRADAAYMANIVDDQRDEAWYEPLAGGLGVYSPAAHRGPFIHVDVRGEPVRW